MKNERTVVEKARLAFELYCIERLKDKKFEFYTPIEGGNIQEIVAKNKKPYVEMKPIYLYRQEYFFPAILFMALRRHNSLILSSKMLGKDEDKKVNLINQFCIAPILYTVPPESNHILQRGIAINEKDLPKITGTSIIMHLVNELELLLDRKPTAHFESMVRAEVADFNKHQCLTVGDVKYINLKTFIVEDYLLFTDGKSREQLFFDYNHQTNTKTKEPTIEDFLRFFDIEFYSALKDAKKALDDETGFGKLDLTQKKESQQQLIPPPNPAKQKNGQQNKRRAGRRK